MVKHSSALSTWVAIIAALAMAVACGVQAGEYHGVDRSVCSDCHTQHASKSGQTWTPTEKLLKNSAGQVALCMSCHDGTSSDSPDITAAGTAANPSSAVSTQYASRYGSSAGFFQNDYLTVVTTYGHSLTPAGSVTAPLSNSYTKAGGLLCSDCHNPHGTANFRNLVSDPNPNHSGSYGIVIGTHVKETTPVNATSPNPAAAYDASNVSFYVQNNISAWCSDCHDVLADNATGSSPAHFKGHPSGVSIGGINAHTDMQNWQSGLQSPTSGFGADIGDLTAGVPRLRYGSPTGSNTIAGSGDTVNCLSCHKAHGSKFKHGLLWPYSEGGADMLSGCQQCHYK